MNNITMILENDKKIFMKIYSLGEKNALIEKIGRTGTKMSYYIFLIIYLAGAYAVYTYKGEYILKYAAVPLLGILLNTTLRKLIGRSRPSNSLGIKSKIGRKKTNSCPSNHSASALLISVSIMQIFPIWGLILLPLAFFTGFSRILTGVHYPLDVLLGFWLGSLVAVLGFMIL